MNRDEVTAHLAELIGQVLPEAANVKIAPELTLRGGLGMDSLTQVDLVTVLERAYGIKIPDEDLGGFESIGDVADYVLEHRSR